MYVFSLFFVFRCILHRKKKSTTNNRQFLFHCSSLSRIYVLFLFFVYRWYICVDLRNDLCCNFSFPSLNDLIFAGKQTNKPIVFLFLCWISLLLFFFFFKCTKQKRTRSTCARFCLLFLFRDFNLTQTSFLYILFLYLYLSLSVFFLVSLLFYCICMLFGFFLCSIWEKSVWHKIRKNKRKETTIKLTSEIIKFEFFFLFFFELANQILMAVIKKILHLVIHYIHICRYSDEQS